jgi:hypothetical protein
MKILLATHALDHPGGSETYLLTVAFALERLGHEAAIYTLEPGAMSELAEQSGLRVAVSDQRLDDGYDAIIGQDGVTSYALAERYPSARHLFVAHSADYAFQYPPQLPGAVGAVVAFNDRVAGRLESLAHCPQLIRLRQPIDTWRFTVRPPLPPRPTSLTVLSNYLYGERLEIVRRAAREMGMSFAVVGSSEGGKPTLTPEEGLRRSDVVLALGRSALEAMACGCAVYVFGHFAADGWVTQDSYRAFERDGFASLATERAIDTDALCADLANYDAAMGTVNRSLVVRHHEAGKHAAELVAALRRLIPENPTRSSDRTLREMSRLVRVQWQTERKALTFDDQLRGAEEARISSEQELQKELERVRGEYRQVVSGRRYRLAQTIAKPLDFLRRHRRRPVPDEEGKASRSAP